MGNKKRYVQITEKISLFYGATYEFIPSKSFLKSFKNKTCQAVQKPELDSLSKESTMCLPKGVSIIRGKEIESKKVQNKKQLIAEDYTKIKGNEEDLWGYALESDIQDSQVCLLGDGWYIDYTLLSSSILIEFWNFSKWGLKQIIEMKRVLEELFYAYRDRLFIADCNKNSIKWIEKLLERGFIEIVKKEDFDYDPNTGYLGFVFKATPAFIDYHESRLKRGRVLLPKKPQKKD